MTKKILSRRNFIAGSLATGGLLFGATYLGLNPLRRALFETLESGPQPYPGNTSDPKLWFEITENNIIRLFSPKVEMGQGTLTGLAQIAAEELEIGIDQIEVQHAASASGQIDDFTGGSTSIASLWTPLRELSATLREMLRIEAGKKLDTPPSQLKISKGVVSNGKESLTYGQIVRDVDNWDLPKTPALKDPKSYAFIGKEIPRIDLADKVFGAPIFGMDAAMPDMLYGSIVRADRVDAVLESVDTEVAKSMPGVVKIIVKEDLIGVVAESYSQAERAKEAIAAVWKPRRPWSTKAIHDMIEVGKGEPFVIQTEGRPDSILNEAEESADKRFYTSEYSSPIGAHAQLEPNGAVAFVENDKATIIISTQVPKITRDEVAEALGFDPEQVNVIPTYLGGGFGRRLHTPNAIQAAILSKEVGKPVKCFFSRKEEFQKDTFRPPTRHLLRATLKSDGSIEAIEHNVSSGDVALGSALIPGALQKIMKADIGAFRGGMIQYRAIPNYRAVSWRVKLPFATSWWRSLGLLANTFAIESFMDELAAATRQSPIDFRLSQIRDDPAGKRLKAVVETAAQRAGYQDRPINGKAMGFACSTDAGTPAAHVVEVSVVDQTIKVHKVTCVMDPGLSVNPDQVKAQCEGSIIMGLSASLYEEMQLDDGELQPTLYGAYRIALLRDSPREIDVVLLDGTGVPGPVGEPPLGPIGAAIANAVYRLTGKRLRNMPLKLA